MPGFLRKYLSDTRRNYYYILILLSASLPLSIYTTSFTEILLLVNWLAERKFTQKFSKLKDRKGALIITLIFFIHIAGLLYSRDFNYALHDLKTKLPLLVLPVIIASSDPLDLKKLRNLLLVFTSAVFISTLISASIFFNLFNLEYNNYKTISIFISHIRLSLMVNLSIFILFYYAFGRDGAAFKELRYRLILIFVAFWLICFLVMLKSITGVVVFIFLLLFMGWKYSSEIKMVAPRFIVRMLIITFPLIIASWLSHAAGKYYYREEVNFSRLDLNTAQGNRYRHDTLKNSAENGHYIWLYVCEDEMRTEWNKISSLDYDGKDHREQYLRFTLIRYLTSKGYRKDAEGVKQLDPEDIKAIESGIANCIFLNKFSLYPRIYEIIWEIDNYWHGNNPSGHSVAQRFAYLDAAGHIIKGNLIFGVGTGDVQMVYDNYYSSSNNQLKPEFRRRAHNQYITFLVTFGLVGFIIIMSSLLIPVFLEKRWGDYLFLCFIIIGFLSMLNEDTLETQTGISFFTFFYAIFLFGRTPPCNSNKKSPDLKEES